MTKQEVVQALAHRLELSRAQAAAAIDALFAHDGIIAAGGSGRRAGSDRRIRELRDPQARSAAQADPRTGSEISIKASTVPAFRAGKALKDLVARRR